MVVALLLLYVLAWRPARAWVAQRAARPLLIVAASRGSTDYAVRMGNDGLTVEVYPAASGLPAIAYRAPAGILFLFPALVLMALFPSEPYWWYLWLLHVALGVLSLLLLLVGVRGQTWVLPADAFLHAYAVPAVSLAMPLLLIVRRSAAVRANDGAGPPRAASRPE